MAASQLDTQRAKFCILFAACNCNSNTIQPLILADKADEIADMDSATTQISILTSAIEHFLNIASTECDYLSRAVC